MEKKFDHLQAQETLNTEWQSRALYAYDSTKPCYSVDTPPPTVSGALHIGHIFSYTQTDMSVRFKRMSGYSVYYPFGFDDNGLPTERFVEKKRNIVAHQLRRSEFIDICLQETHAVEEQFKALWQKIGLSVDWDQCYSTISPLARKVSQESFIRLYKKGYVYRKYEPALFCTACRTSVAQAELDDVQKIAQFTTIRFETNDGQALLIATTRPELLGACAAVLYHPDDKRYAHLKGARAKVPLYDIEVPLIPDELVIMDKGTGLVMSCTFGDKTDILWYKKHNFAYTQVIGFDGRMTHEAGFLQGLKVAAAREAVLEKLRSENYIIEQKTIEHAVNIHERCKQDIEYLALKQWFLNIMSYKKELIEMGEKINWYPHFMKARYKNWVENISWDWCLSRQRFFGIPFPAWHCACGEIILPELAALPVDPQEIAAPKLCPSCGGNDIAPDTDVMDTWNTSSLTPYICSAVKQGSTEGIFEGKSLVPMTMRPQAHDIIRTWAFYTIIKAWMHEDKIPWNDIVISGHVLSTEKEKISKSVGNSPLAPENLLATYPADAIRFWTASGSLGHDVPFSDNQLKIGHKLMTKLWNAFRFIEEHTKDVTKLNTMPQLGVNRWIINQAALCFEKYKRAFNEHEFGLALTAVEQFFWHDVCDNYLELVKDQLFNPANYPQEATQEIKEVLYTVGLRLLQLYAPYMPYVTDTLYRELYMRILGAPSIHVTNFSDVNIVNTYPQEAERLNAVLALVSAVRKLKSDNQLSLKTPIQELRVAASPEVVKQLQGEEALVKGVMHINALSFVDGLPATQLRMQDQSYFADVIV